MMVVIAYDVDTTTAAGAKRLRKVAHLCERYGVRVQNSVFEVLLDAAQLAALKCALEKIVQPDTDSIRFYRLGNSWKGRIDVMGRAAPVEAGEPLLL
ncbi:MAG: CRISPR-associated endonuclease Cas2 [Clostridiaceae bacterium]|nr:CRISPR-associated endonuclease Cas2 [Clostridiaceae bacterium]MDD6273509.1 CRISPR-associated endonuclease Cas2 [Clostridiaceae bacterium]